MLLRGFLGGEPDVQSSRDNGTSIEVAAGARGALPAGSRRRRPRRRVHAAECSRSSRSEFDVLAEAGTMPLAELMPGIDQCQAAVALLFQT